MNRLLKCARARTTARRQRSAAPARAASSVRRVPRLVRVGLVGAVLAAVVVAVPTPGPAAAAEPVAMVVSAPQARTYGSAATVTATVLGDDGNGVSGRV